MVKQECFCCLGQTLLTHVSRQALLSDDGELFQDPVWVLTLCAFS